VIKKNEDLSKHTTIKIGGIARYFYIPETIEELKEIVLKVHDLYIISGGSNLLINDQLVFNNVVSMSKCSNDFRLNEDGTVYVGASIRIQKVIQNLNKHNLGGFEFLYSLPALFGGVVYMNAGRGADGKSIGEFIYSVHVIDKETGEFKEILQNECNFGKRRSVFQNNKSIIIGATLHCNSGTKEVFRNAINDRISHCKKMQDMKYPNFGSCFCEYNGRIMKFERAISRFDHDRARFSDKTINWIVNGGDATYKDVCKKIDHVKKMHALLGKQCKVEVRIWPYEEN